MAEDLGGCLQVFKVCGEERDDIKDTFFWYGTPEILHRYDPKAPRVCWRCRGDIGSHFYIFWECPIIQPFWSSIHAHLQELLETTLSLDPIQFLLGLLFPGIPRQTHPKVGHPYSPGSKKGYPPEMVVPLPAHPCTGSANIRTNP